MTPQVSNMTLLLFDFTGKARDMLEVVARWHQSFSQGRMQYTNIAEEEVVGKGLRAVLG